MVDVIKTRTDLIERAATELGALTSGQSLSDEDRDTIDELVDPLVLQLSVDEIADFPDLEQIPSQLFLPLATLLANTAAPSFGQVFSPEVKAMQERYLRKLTATPATNEPVKALYF